MQAVTHRPSLLKFKLDGCTSIVAGMVGSTNVTAMGEEVVTPAGKQIPHR